MRLRFALTLLCLGINFFPNNKGLGSEISASRSLYPATKVGIKVNPLPTPQGTSYQCGVQDSTKQIKVWASWLIRDQTGSLIRSLNSDRLPPEQIAPGLNYYCQIIADNDVVFSKQLLQFKPEVSIKPSANPSIEMPSFLTTHSTLRLTQIGAIRFAFCEHPKNYRLADKTNWWNNGKLILKTDTNSIPTSHFEPGTIQCAQGPLLPSKEIEFSNELFQDLPKEILLNPVAQSQSLIFASERPIEHVQCLSESEHISCSVHLLEERKHSLLTIWHKQMLRFENLPTESNFGTVKISVGAGSWKESRNIAWRIPSNRIRQVHQRELSIERTATRGDGQESELRCTELSGKDADGQIIWLSKDGRLLSRSSSPFIDLKEIPNEIDELICLAMNLIETGPTEIPASIRFGASRPFSRSQILDEVSQLGTAWAVWGENTVSRPVYFKSLRTLANTARIACFGLSISGNPITPNLCPEGQSLQSIEPSSTEVFRVDLKLNPQILSTLWKEARTNSIYDRYAPRLAHILLINNGKGGSFWGKIPIKILRTNFAPEIQQELNAGDNQCTFNISDPEDDHLVARLDSVVTDFTRAKNSRIATTWDSQHPERATEEPKRNILEISASVPTEGYCDLTTSDGVLVSSTKSNAAGKTFSKFPKYQSRSSDHLKIDTQDLISTSVRGNSDMILPLRVAANNLKTNHFGSHNIQLGLDIPARKVNFCIAPDGSCPKVRITKNGVNMWVDSRSRSGTYLLGFQLTDGSQFLSFLDLAIIPREQVISDVSETDLDCQSILEFQSRGETLLTPPSLQIFFLQNVLKEGKNLPLHSSHHCRKFDSTGLKSNSKIWTRLDMLNRSPNIQNNIGIEQSKPPILYLPLTKEEQIYNLAPQSDSTPSVVKSKEEQLKFWSEIVFREALLSSQLFSAPNVALIEPELCNPKICSWIDRSQQPDFWLKQQLKDRAGRTRTAVLPIQVVSANSLFDRNIPSAIAEFKVREGPSKTNTYECTLNLYYAKNISNPIFVFRYNGAEIKTKQGQLDKTGLWFAETNLGPVDQCQVFMNGKEIAQNDLSVDKISSLQCILVTQSGWVSKVPCADTVGSSAENAQFDEVHISGKIHESNSNTFGLHSPAALYALWKNSSGQLIKTKRHLIGSISTTENSSNKPTPSNADVISNSIEESQFSIYIHRDFKEMPLSIARFIRKIPPEQLQTIHLSCAASKHSLDQCENLQTMLKSQFKTPAQIHIDKKEILEPLSVVELGLRSGEQIESSNSTQEKNKFNWIWLSPTSLKGMTDQEPKP